MGKQSVVIVATLMLGAISACEGRESRQEDRRWKEVVRQDLQARVSTIDTNVKSAAEINQRMAASLDKLGLWQHNPDVEETGLSQCRGRLQEVKLTLNSCQEIIKLSREMVELPDLSPERFNEIVRMIRKVEALCPSGLSQVQEECRHLLNREPAR